MGLYTSTLNMRLKRTLALVPHLDVKCSYNLPINISLIGETREALGHSAGP